MNIAVRICGIFFLTLLVSCEETHHKHHKEAEAYRQKIEVLESSFAEEQNALRWKEAPYANLFTASLQRKIKEQAVVLPIYIDDILYENDDKQPILYAKATVPHPNLRSLQLFIRMPLPQKQLEELEEIMTTSSENCNEERHRFLAFVPKTFEKIPSQCGGDKYLEWEPAYRLIIDGTFVDWKGFP